MVCVADLLNPKQTFPITQLKYKHWWVSVDEICLFGTRPRCWVDFIMQTHCNNSPQVHVDMLSTLKHYPNSKTAAALAR